MTLIIKRINPTESTHQSAHKCTKKQGYLPSHSCAKGVGSVSLEHPAQDTPPAQEKQGFEVILEQVFGVQNETHTTTTLKGNLSITVPVLVHHWREVGLSDKAICKRLKERFPTEYRNTRDYWDNKKRNIRKDPRGIFMEDDFGKSFPHFLVAVGGFRPSPIHSLDRIDNGAGYTLSNVRWSVPSEQQHNRGAIGEINHYRRATGCSRATAYRHRKAKVKDFIELSQPTLPVTRLWNDERQLWELFYSEVQALYPDTYKPNNPSHADIGQFKKLLKQHTKAVLMEAIPAMVQSWSTVQPRFRKLFGWNIGEKPNLKALYHHAGDLIDAVYQIRYEQEREAQLQAERELERLQLQAQQGYQEAITHTPSAPKCTPKPKHVPMTLEEFEAISAQIGLRWGITE